MFGLRSLVILSLVIPGHLMAQGGSSKSGAAAALQIKVYDASITVSLAGVQAPQVFLRLQNSGNQAVTLVSAVCAFAQQVRLVSAADRKVMNTLQIPPHSVIDLSAKTQYLLLDKLKAGYQTGDLLHLELVFSDSSRVPVTAVAKSAFDQPHH